MSYKITKNIHMIINPNDIFRQIGLAVDHDTSRTNLNKSNFKTKPNYVICLEIQLSQNEKHIMEVKDTDDPHTKSEEFCRKHRLNKLAVNLVQSKIRQAKQFQEQKLGKSRNKTNTNAKSRKQQNNLGKSQSRRNDKYNQSPYQTKKSPEKKSSPNKSKSKQKSISKSKQKSKMTKVGSSDNIYLRSVVRSRLLQQQKDKIKVQIEKKQEQKLTFKPKINNVSSKIVQFLRNNNIPKQKKYSPPKRMYDEMQQCTFKPKINKVSERIVSNKSALKQQRENHKNMFDQDSQSMQKSSKKTISQQQFSFQPQINPKSAEKVTIPFFKRLQIAQQKKNKAMNQQNFCDEDQCSFQPKIGRGPFKDRNKQNLKIWQYLYYGSKKESNVNPIETHNNQVQSFKQSTTSQLYYQNLIEQRINQVFHLLDSNRDGLISPNQIAIQLLPTQCLQFLKPIFMEMDQIDATLNFYQFKRAVRALMADSDPGSKGLFISSKWKKQLEQRHSYKPTIDKKSRQLSVNRSVQNLYKQGLKQKKNKEYRLERQRALRQQKQLAQCSFKPVLNHSSKVYIKKIGSKRTQNQPKNIQDLMNSYIHESESRQ